MKLLVLSDTHKFIDNIKKVLEYLINDIDVLIHLGDCVDDVFYIKNKYKNLKVYNVSGNCDFNTNVSKIKIIYLNTKKIYICHGDQYNVKVSYDNLIDVAIKNEVDICLFGHIHYPDIFYRENILFMNPGSLCLPRYGSLYSYGIINISKDGHIVPKIYNIN